VATSLYDVVSNLRQLSWRGVTAACLTTDFSFTQRQAKREYPYVDGESHDHTGRGSYQVTAELIFSNTIERGAIPDKLETWIANVEAGSIGKLQHPVLGEFDARVVSVNGKVDPSKDRAGIILSVTWTESIPDPTQSPQFFLGAVPTATYGKSLDEAIAAAGVGSVPTSLGHSTYQSAVQNVNTLPVGSLQYEQECRRIAGICDGVAVEVRALDTNRYWPVVDLAETLSQALYEKAALSASKRLRGTAIEVVQSDTTLDAFATRVGNAFDDVLALNVARITSPRVPRGTALTYYTS